jgi:hypothetical protein
MASAIASTVDATLARHPGAGKHMFESALDIEHTFGQHVGMRRTYLRRRLVALAIGLAVLGWGVPAAAGGPSADRTEVGGVTYVVLPGDTLWDIAVRLAPAEDPRVVIARIAEANDIDAGSIAPGQTLLVPRV